jgi:hypothetical protein
MRFRLKADYSFEAEDIDDALLILSHHFLSQSLGVVSAVYGELGDPPATSSLSDEV